MGLYQKLLDDGIAHSPLEAELARQIDKLNSMIEGQRNDIKSIWDLITESIRC